MNIFRSSRKNKLPPLSPTSTLQSSSSAEGAADVGSREASRLKQHQKRSPRLDRTNAVRYIEYDWVAENGGCDAESSRKGNLTSRSLDIYADKASLRINGENNERVERLCQSLGLCSPDDFGIPIAAWEARKARCASDFLPRPRMFDGSCLDCSSSPPPSPKLCNLGKELKREEEEEAKEKKEDQSSVISDMFSVACSVCNGEELESAKSPNFSIDLGDSGGRRSGGGIRGVRPPILDTASYLPPPPRMYLPAADEATTAWDLVNSFAPEDESGVRVTEQLGRKSSVLHYDSRIQEEDEGVSEEYKGLRFVVSSGGEFIGSASFTTTSNDDDCSSTTTEGIYVISPYARCKPHVGQWTRGQELGRGSYGVVYEAFSEVGDFFAVKEISLLDQGNDEIEQLEREIGFLSNFEHENIVQYLGTDKREAKLYILLELVTQGSLASLYKKYDLQDSQVSPYTRQILNGLKYLHSRNVVHRDIKCANILVTANGSVKLADFGLAKQTTAIGLLRSCKGSVYWMAPEVINPKKGRGYGTSADIWSLGCTVLEMFTQQPPYQHLEWAQAFYQIGNGLKPNIPDSLSRDATDFIRQCVQPNPDDRPTASKLLEHPFVRRQSPASLMYGLDSSGRGRQT